MTLSVSELLFEERELLTELPYGRTGLGQLGLAAIQLPLEGVDPLAHLVQLPAYRLDDVLVGPGQDLP